MEIPDGALALYASPPARFSAERSALAAALAAEGAPEASAVRRLRRPVGLAWVLNRLARDHGEEVAALLEAGERLRRAQRRALAGAGGEELRESAGALRDRAGALRDRAARILEAEGERGARGKLPRLELLLRAAASSPDPALRAALRRGSLVREPDVAAGELSGLAVLAGGGAAPRRAGGDASPGGAPSGDAAARREREARARARGLERSRAGAARDEEAARAAEAKAERAAAAAQRALAASERAQARAAALRARADRARREADAPEGPPRRGGR